MIFLPSHATMKTHRIVIPAITYTAILSLLSCNTEDPSAIGEIQRDLAESVAKNSRLEEEITSLTEQLQLVQKSGAEAGGMKMPTRAEIEQSLAIDGTRLKDAARELHPAANVESYRTFDLKIPSFEMPFSCIAEIQLREPSGKSTTLYWTGKANMKGEWQFDRAENLVAKATTSQPNTAAHPQQPKEEFEHDIPLVDPLIQPPGSVASGAETNQPKQPASAPENPKVQYDIPLDNPVMRPKGR